jgi:hypothetical protein
MAPGVTQEGLRALQLGMSKEQVIAVLGAPLGEDHRRSDQVGLEYARKPSGIVISAFVRDTGLVLVAVHDVDQNKQCACSAGSCSETWFEKCAASIPSRP